MNKKYFSYITIISFLISFSLTIQTTFAGVVPGTIKKGSFTSSVECKNTPNIISPDSGNCIDDGKQCIKTPYIPEVPCTPYDTVPCTDIGSLGCVGGSPAGCSGGSPEVPATYQSCGTTVPTTSGYHYAYDKDYNSSNPSFSSSSYNKILLDDLNRSCSNSANGTKYKLTVNGPYYCTVGSYIYYSGTNGTCNIYSSTDNLMNNITQVGGYSSPSPSDSDGSCTVEGRYADSDSSVSDSVILNLDSVFNAGDDVWCNINKYKAPGVKYLEHPGCKFYDDKNATNNFGEDLLKGLTITIPGDVSGIGSVEIQLGTCNGTITSNSNDLNTILVDIISASGVKPTYTNGFTISYNSTVFALGKSQPSLLTLFSKARLDECLTEGKNKLVVEIKDMARNDKDGITLASNSVKYISAGSINIDNSNVYLDFQTDFKDSINGLTPPDTTINNNILWKNHTIEGNIMMGEKYKGGPKNECNPFKAENTGDCNTGNPSKPTNNDLIWIFPNGVNPTSGIYTQYTCGNTKFPTNLDCQWGCKDPAKVWDGNSCVSGCSAEKVNIPGVGCMDYCIADKTVDCIVKEDGPVNTLPYCMGDGQVDCIVKEDGPVNTLPYCMGDGQVDCIVKEDGTSTPINTNTLPYCMGDGQVDCIVKEN